MCSNVSLTNCYYVPVVTGTIVSVIGVVASLVYHSDFLAASFGITGVCSLCVANLPGKYKELQETSKVIQRLENEVDTLRKANAAFALQIAEFQRNNEELTDRVRHFSDLNQQLAESITRLNGENATFKSENIKLGETRSGIQQQLERFQKSNAELTAFSERHHSQMAEFAKLQQAFEVFHKTCAENTKESLRLASEELRSTLDEFQRSYASERSHGKKFMENLESLATAMGVTFQKIGEWTSGEVFKKLQTEVRQMEVQKAGLTAAVDGLKQQVTDLQASCGELRAHAVDLREQCSVLRMQNETYAKQNVRLSENVDKLRTIVRSAQSGEVAIAAIAR